MRRRRESSGALGQRGRLRHARQPSCFDATLGRWFGASDQQLLDVLPNLTQFKSGNLGFMI